MRLDFWSEQISLRLLWIIFPNGIDSDKLRFVESRDFLLEEENDIVKSHICCIRSISKEISPNFISGFLLKIKCIPTSVSFLKQIFSTDSFKSSKQPSKFLIHCQGLSLYVFLKIRSLKRHYYLLIFRGILLGKWLFYRYSQQLTFLNTNIILYTIINGQIYGQ